MLGTKDPTSKQNKRKPKNTRAQQDNKRTKIRSRNGFQIPSLKTIVYQHFPENKQYKQKT